MADHVIIDIKALSVEYSSKYGKVRAVDHVDLQVHRGEVLGLVGESGCGKTTLAFAVMRMIERPHQITSGQIVYSGLGDVLQMPREQLRRYRWEKVAMVFQATQNAFNPVLTIKEQALKLYRSHRPRAREREVVDRLGDLCRVVNLEPRRILGSYPHELSGGMRQRIGIVLALLLEPEVVILDEPTTALDVISQALILENLRHIHRQLGTTMIFVTHDMSVVAEIADRVAVMYAGKLVELGTIEDTFYRPAHPYTKALLRAIPSLDADPTNLQPIPGRAPDPLERPSGCPFHPRCPVALSLCREHDPAMYVVGEKHAAACLLVGQASQEVVK